MTRLVIHDPRASWRKCKICGHIVNPDTETCEEMHLPCSHKGCVVKKP